MVSIKNPSEFIVYRTSNVILQIYVFHTTQQLSQDTYPSDMLPSNTAKFPSNLSGFEKSCPIAAEVPAIRKISESRASKHAEITFDFRQSLVLYHLRSNGTHLLKICRNSCKSVQDYLIQRRVVIRYHADILTDLQT